MPPFQQGSGDDRDDHQNPSDPDRIGIGSCAGRADIENATKPGGQISANPIANRKRRHAQPGTDAEQVRPLDFPTVFHQEGTAGHAPQA